MEYKRFVKSDKGVSPVIGVILMVAITVVMAAIVSSWSASVKPPAAPVTVGLDISRSTNNITIVVTSIDPSIEAPIPVLNISYYNATDVVTIDGTQTNTTGMQNADVGNKKTIDTGASTPKLLIIRATFKDSSKKVLYSRET